MEKQLLREPEIFPSKEVLKDLLGDVYEVFDNMETSLVRDEYALTFNWVYYKDAKSWLCKVSHKNKTVFWLSIWEGFFKIGFYFLERHLEGIAALQIDEKNYIIGKEIGKSIPFIFNIIDKMQLPDLLKMVTFKKQSK